MVPDARIGPRWTLLGRVLIIAAAWGLMYSSYKVGLERSGPLWLASLRFEAFALAALVASLFVRGALRVPSTGRDWAAVLAYAGLNVVLHNLGTIGGAGHVSVAVIGVLAGTTPLLTAGFAWVLPPRSRFGPWTLGGLLLGFVGVAFLAAQRNAGGDWAISFWAIVVLLGFAAWALGTVLIRWADSALHGLSIGFWGSLSALLVLQPAALVLEPLPRFDAVLVAIAAFAGAVGGVLAFLLWLGLVRKHGARNANLVSYVSPIATTLSGILFLDEPFSPVALLAYAFIAAGLGLVIHDMPRSAGADAAATAVENASPSRPRG